MESTGVAGTPPDPEVSMMTVAHQSSTRSPSLTTIVLTGMTFGDESVSLTLRGGRIGPLISPTSTARAVMFVRFCRVVDA